MRDRNRRGRFQSNYAAHQANLLLELRELAAANLTWEDAAPYLGKGNFEAAALLFEKYGDKLAIRAIYHNKVSGRTMTDEAIKTIATDTTGLPPVVGRDPGWKVLKRWWLDAGGRRFTSVTFVLDGRGRVLIRYSGTESKARVMVEGDDEKRVHQVAHELAGELRQALG